MKEILDRAFPTITSNKKSNWKKGLHVMIAKGKVNTQFYSLLDIMRAILLAKVCQINRSGTYALTMCKP